MFGDFEEQQKLMDKKLKAIKIEHSSNENEIKITLTASLEIENI